MAGGQPPASAIPIGERQYQVLKKYNERRNIPNHFKLRSGIILGASQGHSNKGLARQLGINYNTVKKWRRCWQQYYDELCEYEKGESNQGVSDKQLLDKMLEILSDIPRSGTPIRITLAQKQQIVALACEKPEDHGIAMTQWNREMLAHVAMAKGIVESISPRYVSQILKKTNFDPTNPDTGCSPK